MSESAFFVYFDLKGLGEGVRMLLTLCKIPYEERRLDPYGSEWPEVKKEAPMNQLPYLDIDGMRLHQSRAICKYLARKINLDGDNDKEKLYIDMAADVLYDFVMKLRVLRDIENATAREKKFNEFKKTIIPKYLGALDDMVKNSGGYFANGKLSWVDLYFTGAHDVLSKQVAFNIGESYIHLQSVVDKVNALPELQHYLKFRPVSDI